MNEIEFKVMHLLTLRSHLFLSVEDFLFLMTREEAESALESLNESKFVGKAVINPSELGGDCENCEFAFFATTTGELQLRLEDKKRESIPTVAH